MTHSQLHWPSTDLEALKARLHRVDEFLIIQDLDGVCMGLVNDPLTRRIEPGYLHAVSRLKGRFFVLTNGEHIGCRGVNGIVDRALSESDAEPEDHGLYLPGLAAGGVQWQTAGGQVSHPGVEEAELEFLASIPARARVFLDHWLSARDLGLSGSALERLIDATVLDNRVSPTLNLNSLYRVLRDSLETYRQLQTDALGFMHQCLADAQALGLDDAFFIHLAPNQGSEAGVERLKPASETGAGTTDIQFMLRGAVKEAGVLALLNRYYGTRTGQYPLGEAFSVRQAPRSLEALITLAQDAFDPELMPVLVGVGDTLTSFPDKGHYQRGGSDRGFLTLLKALGDRFHTDSLALFVDSSGGEVARPGVLASELDTDPARALAGITDPEDPLKIDFVFTGGHHQYVSFFCDLAHGLTHPGGSIP
ncbi:glucosylglycerol 3-phosphatase [Marinobacterium litorale]|uniref:glucosylglycerol 3-phosphatase n=1 Tax=Marinobacterium litorale TaxID=404770 RepID=UPI0004299FB8|nr:glucosylglycerol 3-phosphatase [Marinobacterium litorale]